jgi:HEAT repeat protein
MKKSFLLAFAVLLGASAVGRAADGGDKLIGDLVAVFKDPKNTPEVRTTAIRALEPLGWPGRSGVPVLVKFLDDPDEKKAAREVLGPYYQAIQVLGRVGPSAREAVPTLVRAKGIAPTYDQAIEIALENILTPAAGTVYTLLGQLRDNDPSVRLMAAKTLRFYPAEAGLAMPALRESITHDPDADVKAVARESLKLLTQAEVNRLAQLLKDRDENVRLLAAKALGRMGADAAPAVPALKDVADKDTDADVRAVAKSAVEKIARPKP